MGSNTIIAIVVGAILVIVGFALWPVLNGASNSLYSYFQDSCDDGNGNRFTKAYLGDSTTQTFPSDPDPRTYYTIPRVHGGAGVALEAGDHGACLGPNVRDGLPALDADSTRLATTTPTIAYNLGKAYNEQGDVIGIATSTAEGADRFLPNNSAGDTAAQAAFDAVYVNWDSGDTYSWIKVAPMLDRFSGINNLLLTVIPVVSIAGFLGISGAKLYSYGKGTSSIGSSISTSVFTLIGIVIAMVIAGPVLGQAVAANQVVVSGQYEVNGTFGNIISLLFAMIPVIYIAGLVTLVGLQARTALMGGKSDGSVG